MTVNIALDQLLQIEQKRKEKVISKNTLALGCARLGSNEFKIKYGKIHELLKYDFGNPLHCLIFPGKLHFIEEDMVNCFAI